MNILLKKLFHTVGYLLICGAVGAQSLAEAKKLYNEGEYAKAKPAFEKLVRQSPSNGSYNHWYGVCCYETGDLQNAEKHLTVAAKRKVQEANRYLAEVYYRTYRFDESAEKWEEYIEMLAKKKLETEVFESKLKLANDAHRMMEKTEDVQIIDSVVVDKNDFLSAYLLSGENGTLTTYQQFFGTRQPVYSTVFKNQKGDKIYYAHPTDSGTYNLFSQSLLLDSWGDEKPLSISPENQADKNFPFVLSDGATIYYASKGADAIGGYDLFVTRYNINNDTFLAPEQLGMPFNSIFNDYMIVFDEIKGLGWFVSDRFQPEDKVCVYLFIPNPEHNRIESEDTGYKRTRAAVTAIHDSWKESEKYTELIALAHKEIGYGEPEPEKDFEFILGNGTVYYTWEEIQNPEARNIYEKAMAVDRQIRDLTNKLDALRISYTQTGKAGREQLKQTILQAESQLESLLDQPADLEKRARNAEINYLLKHKP